MATLWTGLALGQAPDATPAKKLDAKSDGKAGVGKKLDAPPEIPAVAALLETKPTAPWDCLRAATILVEYDREELARGFLKKVLDAKLSPAQLAALGEQATAATILDLAARPKLQPEGKQLAGLWEFPGGKIDPGERPEDALIRELAEELGIAVKAPCLAPLTFASHAYEEFHLLMPLYVCRKWEGFVTPAEGQAVKWARTRDLRNYAMPPADAPLIAPLIDLLG